MPYTCKPVGTKYHLQKKDGSKTFGTHSTRKECLAQMRAIYYKELNAENNLRFEDTIFLPWDLDQKIEDAKDEIHVVVNSKGGSFLDSMIIHNKLRASGKKVIGHVVQLAASAGANILLACDEVYIPENGIIMFHMPRVRLDDDKTASQLKQLAESLEALEATLVSTLMAKTKKSEDECKEMLNKETYLTPAQALELGIVTEIVPLHETIKNEFRNCFPAEIVQFVNEMQSKESNMAMKDVCQKFGIEESDDALIAFIENLQKNQPKKKMEVSNSIVNIVKNSRETELNSLVNDGFVTAAVVNDLKLEYTNEDRIKQEVQSLDDPNKEFAKFVNALRKNEVVVSFKGKSGTQQIDKGSKDDPNGDKPKPNVLLAAVNKLKEQEVHD